MVWKTMHRSLFTGSAAEQSEISKANTQTEKETAHYGEALKQGHLHPHPFTRHVTGYYSITFVSAKEKEKMPEVSFSLHV